MYLTTPFPNTTLSIHLLQYTYFLLKILNYINDKPIHRIQFQFQIALSICGTLLRLNWQQLQNAFEFDVGPIWADKCECVDCVNIQDYMASHYIRGAALHGGSSVNSSDYSEINPTNSMNSLCHMAPRII